MIKKAIVAHFTALLLFTFIYASLPEDTFEFSDRNRKPSLFDFFNMATTIQSGVGLTSLYPKSDFGIFFTTTQQLLMIVKNIFILHFFTRF